MRTPKRKTLAAVFLAAGLTLPACSDATDPSAEQLSAEQAREIAASERAEAESHGAESSGSESHGSESSSTEAHGSESSSDAATSGPAESGSSDAGTTTGGTGTTTGDEITQAALERVQRELPGLVGLIPEAQLREIAAQVCGAIESGGVEQGQQVLESRLGLNVSTAEDAAGLIQRNICTA